MASTAANMVEQLAAARANEATRQGKGAFGEAVAAAFLHHVLGHEVVFDESARAGPQGIDLVTVEDGSQGPQLFVVEVKATGREAAGRPSMTRSTGQMSDQWAADRTAASGLDQVAKEDIASGAVAKVAVQVDLASGMLGVWEVDAAGKAADAPSYGIDLDDLARFADAVNGGA